MFLVPSHVPTDSLVSEGISMSVASTDAELLTRFVEQRDQEAFTLLVERHIRWLYPAALRLLHDPGRAQDVTQAVFILLAQKAGGMRRDLPLSPWLFRVLQYTICSLRRAERRRAGHEARVEGARPSAADDAAWLELSEVLDLAIARLSTADRKAILLRFYEDQSLAAIGNVLRTSEEGAKKRVARALERLREQFRHLGVTGATLGTVPGLLSAHLATSIPGVSVSSIASNALGVAGSGITNSVVLAKGAAKMMMFVKVKTAGILSFASVVLVACVLIIRGIANTSAAVSDRVDFRIAVLPSEIGASDLETATGSLKSKGPDEPVKVDDTAARWFEIHSMFKESLLHSNCVISVRDGQSYMLCYDDHDHALIHADPQRRPWSVIAGNPYQDSSGGVTLPFELNAVGANYLGELTGGNKGHPMAMLVDNHVVNAPVIQAGITSAGVITFGPPTPTHPATEILKEARQIRQMMNTARPADSQPAR
jgi:RNA polymerase sigma factor (sigma-70 family)